MRHVMPALAAVGFTVAVLLIVNNALVIVGRLAP